MKSRTLWAGCVFLVCLGFVQADEFTATLIKVADGKITFSRGGGKKKKDTTLPAAENCQVFVAKYDKKAKTIDAGDEVAGGLKNPIFSQLDKEAVEAWIRTNKANDTIVELRLFQKAKKNKD